MASIPLAGSTTRPPLITKPAMSLLPHAESQFPQRRHQLSEAHRTGRVQAGATPIEADFPSGNNSADRHGFTARST
jgi:hypothetical protein